MCLSPALDLSKGGRRDAVGFNRLGHRPTIGNAQVALGQVATADRGPLQGDVGRNSFCRRHPLASTWRVWYPKGMSKISLLYSVLLLVVLLTACVPVSGVSPTAAPLSPSLTVTTKPTLPPPTVTPIPSVTRPSLTLDDFADPPFAPLIQRYLDAGGDPTALEAMLNTIIADPAQKAPIRAKVICVDVTGDGVDEVALTLTIPRGGDYVDTSLLVLTPQSGHYETILEFIRAPLETLTDADGYRFLAIVDMNRNGTKELVVDLAIGGDHRFWILGWDGTQIRSLLEPQRDPLSFETVDYIFIPNGTGIVRDVDGDGLLELYTIRYRPEGEGPRHCGAKDIWEWDGTVFRHVHHVL